MYEFFALSFLVVLFRQVGFAMFFLGGAFFAGWIMRFAKKGFFAQCYGGKGGFSLSPLRKRNGRDRNGK